MLTNAQHYDVYSCIRPKVRSKKVYTTDTWVSVPQYIQLLATIVYSRNIWKLWHVDSINMFFDSLHITLLDCFNKFHLTLFVFLAQTVLHSTFRVILFMYTLNVQCCGIEQRTTPATSNTKPYSKHYEWPCINTQTLCAILSQNGGTAVLASYIRTVEPFLVKNGCGQTV